MNRLKSKGISVVDIAKEQLKTEMENFDSQMIKLLSYEDFIEVMNEVYNAAIIKDIIE